MHVIAIQSCQIVKSIPCPPPRRCWVTETRSSRRKFPDSQQPRDIPIAFLGTFFERGKYLDKAIKFV